MVYSKDPKKVQQETIIILRKLIKARFMINIKKKQTFYKRVEYVGLKVNKGVQ